MNSISKKWQAWNDKFIDLTQREKVILAFAAVFLTCFAVFKLTIEPTTQALTKAEKSVRSTASQLVATNNQVVEIQNALKVDPNEKIKSEITVLKKSIRELENNLENVMTEYIAPKQMTTELTKLLKSSENIRIVGVSALQPERIQHNTDLSLPNYFRHQFVLEVNGDYFALMSFMKRITSKNVQFSVQDLNYNVVDYPNALMTLTLLTISDSENVIRL